MNPVSSAANSQNMAIQLLTMSLAAEQTKADVVTQTLSELNREPLTMRQRMAHTFNLNTKIIAAGVALKGMNLDKVV